MKPKQSAPASMVDSKGIRAHEVPGIFTDGPSLASEELEPPFELCVGEGASLRRERHDELPQCNGRLKGCQRKADES